MYDGDVRDLDAIKSWIATEMAKKPPVVKFKEKKQLERLFMGPTT